MLYHKKPAWVIQDDSMYSEPRESDEEAVLGVEGYQQAHEGEGSGYIDEGTGNNGKQVRWAQRLHRYQRG